MKLSQQGVALISVLFIVVILTLLISQIFTRIWSDLEQTRWLIENAQAYQNALGGEQLARQILFQNMQELKKQGLSTSPIPYALPVYKPENGEIRLKITDLQSRININNALGSIGERKTLDNFFISVFQQPALLPALHDWLDADTLPRPGGFEDSHYLSQQPAYRTANRVITDSSEIILLQGVDTRRLRDLKPYMVALKKSTPLNINSLSVELAGLIDPEITASQLDAKRRKLIAGFSSVEEFMLTDIVAGLAIDPSAITVFSNYFGTSILATAGNSRITLSSRMRLDAGTGKITLIDRSFLMQPSIKKQLTNLDQEIQDAVNPSF